MVDEIPSQLSKELKTEMKEVVDECTEEIFNKWVEGEIMHENFDIRKNILKLSEKEDIIKYKEYVYDRTTFENHGKTVLLMKDKEFIKEKSNDMMSMLVWLIIQLRFMKENRLWKIQKEKRFIF